MKIKLITIGKTNANYLKEGEKIYLDRLKHYIPTEKIEIPDLKKMGRISKEDLKQKEGELILKYVNPGERLILLDEKGKDFDSEKFAKYLQSHMNMGGKAICFAVGGGFGFSKNIYEKADGKIRLSSMTFNHEMIRLFFLEQLYRGFSILKGEPYHNS